MKDIFRNVQRKDQLSDMLDLEVLCSSSDLPAVTNRAQTFIEVASLGAQKRPYPVQQKVLNGLTTFVAAMSTSRSGGAPGTRASSAKDHGHARLFSSKRELRFGLMAHN